jgi:hypothetical protein
VEKCKKYYAFFCYSIAGYKLGIYVNPVQSSLSKLHFPWVITCLKNMGKIWNFSSHFCRFFHRIYILGYAVPCAFEITFCAITFPVQLHQNLLYMAGTSAPVSGSARPSAKRLEPRLSLPVLCVYMGFTIGITFFICEDLCFCSLLTVW